MPQTSATFVPGQFTRPRPSRLGEAVAAVVSIMSGDGRHIPTRQNPPGARAFALLPSHSGMPYSYNGAGYIVQANGASQMLSGPQVTWAQAAQIDSVQGLVFSGAYQQGLIDWASYLNTPRG